MDPTTALAMAGWFVQVIFDKLADTALQAWASRVHLREEIELLLTCLSSTSVLIEAARGRREIGNTALAKCICELECLALAAEDLVDELDFYRLQAQVEGPGRQQVKSPAVTSARQIMTTSITGLVSRFGFGSPVASTAPKTQGIGLDQRRYSSQIKEIINKFDIIGGSVMQGLKLKSLHSISEEIRKVPTEKHQTTKYTTVKMIGRTKEVKHILRFLSSNSTDEVISILPIVGNGGIGKTTLARYLYNHPRIKQLFDLQMWVSVSGSFDEVSIIRDMLEHVTRDRHAEIHSLNVLQEILEEQLKKVNRFFLVLDDMWDLRDVKHWETLLAPMRARKKNGNNIILVTTRRNSLVEKLGAKEHIPLGGLGDGEFWSLFETCAFGPVETENSEYLKFIGKEIAKQLNGYPLAAKSVGGLLKRNHDVLHWKRILNANAWKYLQDDGDIIPTLKLSYNHLPFALQRCFAYCSLFPKKYCFDWKELVYLWVAQGFIPAQKSKNMEETGKEYLSMLLDWAFFDHFRGKYVMHDLMHDLAQMVSLNDCLCLDGSNIRDIPSTVRHISIITKFAYGKDQQSKELQCNESFEIQLIEVCSSLEMEELRTLLLIGQYDSGFAKTFATLFEKAKRLRVLCLTGMHYDLNHLICNFENLIHLRYLALSTFKAGRPLPKSLCNLYHLQFLDIRRCKHLSDLPEGVDNLISLHRLLAEKELHSMIPNIGKLSFLQTLSEFRVRMVGGFEITQLKNLGELGGTLRIFGLENVETKEEARGARLAHKKHLRKLCLIWEKGRANSGYVANGYVLEGLKPHGNLRELLISGYGGDILPAWFDAKMALTSLENLSIENCKFLDSLPPLGQLPCLKKLRLVNLGALKEIKDQFYGSPRVNSFPALEHIEVLDMPILKKWMATDGEMFFHSLTLLAIINCGKLEELPFEGKHWFCSLSKVTIENCHMLHHQVLLPFSDKLSIVSVNKAGESGSINLRDGNLKIKHVGAGTAVRIFQVVHQNLYKITALNLKYCQKISHLLWDGFNQSTSFKQLQLLECPKFISVKKLLMEACHVTGKQLSLMLLELPSLSKLSIKKCVPADPVDGDDCLLEIPASLAFLKHLIIVDCDSLKMNIRDGFSELSSLQEVQIIDCPNFFSSLAQSNDQIKSNLSSVLPASVKTLRVSDLSDDLSIRLLLNLSLLDELRVIKSPKLSVLNLQSCNSTKKLVIKSCEKLSSITGIEFINKPNCLWIQKCPALLSSLLGELQSVKVLGISTSSLLADTLAKYISLLQHLNLDFTSRTQLEQPTGLTMGHEGFKSLVSLRTLKFINCVNLQSLPPELCCMMSLEELWVSDCPKIVELPLKGLPMSLKSMFVYRCSKELKEQCRNIPGVTVHS